MSISASWTACSASSAQAAGGHAAIEAQTKITAAANLSVNALRSIADRLAPRTSLDSIVTALPDSHFHDRAEAAQAFLEWCMTDEDANKIWEKWGFELAQN